MEASVSVLAKRFALPVQDMTQFRVIGCVQEMHVPVFVKDFKYTQCLGMSLVPLVKNES